MKDKLLSNNLSHNEEKKVKTESLMKEELLLDLE